MLQVLFAVSLISNPGQGGIFDGDLRFGKPVSVRFEAVTMESALIEIGKQINAPLLVSSAIKNDLLIAFCKNKPAKEVLTQIANHFDWQWVADGEGFRLIRPPGQDVKEAAAADKQAIQTMLDLQKEVKEALGKANTVDGEQVKKKIRELNLKISELEEKQNNTRESWKTLSPLYEELARLEQMIDPYSKFGKLIFAELSEKHLMEIEKRGRIVLSYRPTAAQQPLPRNGNQSATRLVNEIIANRIAENNEGQTPDSDEPGFGTVVTPFNANEVGTVRIIFENDGGHYGRYMRPVVAVISNNGKILAKGYPTIVSEFESGEIPSTEAQTYMPSPEHGILNEKLERTDSLKEAMSLLEGGEMGMIKLMAKLLNPDESIDPIYPVAHILIEIASATNQNLIADAYDSAASFMRGHSISGDTAAQLLSELSESIGSVFKFENSWIKMRTVDWELARASSLPRDVILKFRELAFKQCGLTIDQMAELAIKLTDRQLESEVLQVTIGFTNMGMLESGGRNVQYLLRAWSVLSPLEKTYIASGSPIPWSSLNIQSRKYLGEFIYREGEGGFQSFDFMGIDEIEDIERMPAPAMTPESMGEDKEITQILPNGPLGNSLVTFELKRTDAISAQVNFAGVKFPMSLPLSAFAGMKMMTDGDMEFNAPVEFSLVKPGVSERLNVKMQLLPDLQRAGSISGATAKEGFEYGPVESLPAELKQKLKVQEERFKKLRDQMGKPEPPPPPPPSNFWYPSIP